MKIFLMAGQSNMAGRGKIVDVKLVVDKRIQMFKNGKWMPMMEPMNHDFPHAGVGPAAGFAKCYLEAHPEETVGLVPCALGDTTLEDWKPYGTMFENAVMQTRLALRAANELAPAAILWHQGEAEGLAERVQQMEERLKGIIACFRNAFSAPALPFLIGGIGVDFLGGSLYLETAKYHSRIDEILCKTAQETENVYYATGKGLTCLPDHNHFDAVSCRVLGRRYHVILEEKRNLTEPLPDDDAYGASWLAEKPLDDADRLMIYVKELLS